MPQDVDIYNWTAYASGLYYSNDQTAALDTDVTTLWTGTDTGNTLGSAGYITFVNSRVEMSATGNAQIIVERVAGGAGAVGINLSTYNTTGDIAMNSTTHFTAVTGKTVSWANGEMGQKSINVVVGTAPAAGLHMFGVTMDTATGGASIKHPECHVYFDDGGVNTSATSVTSATQSTLQTTINAASAGDLIYARDTSGVYTYNVRNGTNNYSGYTITNTAGIKTAPIIVANYPGESPVIDQNYADADDAGGLDITVGVLFTDGVDYVHIKGFEIKECKATGVMFDQGATVRMNYNVIEDCNIHDCANWDAANYIGSNAYDNIGGVRLDHSTGTIVRNNNIHEIYTPGSTSNPINSVLFGLNNGIHGFYVETAWVENNTFDSLKSSMYRKQAINTAGGGEGFDFVRNKSTNLTNSVIFMGLTGSGNEPGINDLIRDNESVLDHSLDPNICLIRAVYLAGEPLSQPKGLTVTGNTQVGGDALWYLQMFEDVVAYNNVISSSENNLSMQACGTDVSPTSYLNDAATLSNSQITFMDYNCWYNQTSTFFTMRRYGTTPKNYTLLTGTGGWDECVSVASETDVDADPDTNSIATAPTYVSSGTGDYRTTSGVTVATGRFSRDMGIGSELVGVQ